jgi:hypothetical protein
MSPNACAVERPVFRRPPRRFRALVSPLGIRRSAMVNVGVIPAPGVRMLPPFLPFTARPLRRSTVKRVVPAFLRELMAAGDTRSIKAERLILKPDRLPPGGRMRILDR